MNGLKQYHLRATLFLMFASCSTFGAQIYIFNLNATCHQLFPNIRLVSIETDKGVKSINKPVPAMVISEDPSSKKYKEEKLKKGLYFDFAGQSIKTITLQIGDDRYRTNDLDIKLLSPGAELYILCGYSGTPGYVYRKSQFDDLMPVENGRVLPALFINVTAQEREAAAKKKEEEEREARKKQEAAERAEKEKNIAAREKELAEREKRLKEMEEALSKKNNGK